MALARYHAKRNFKVTPEPRGRVAAKDTQSRAYLIQKHAASHLHYDFRLELNGVLLSWAVPRGPSLDPADKRLAMHVEDHPLDYGKFEGIIPKGQYGGGTVMLWDHGTWNPVGDPQEGIKRGHLKFDLSGEKLKGQWALIKTRGNKFGGKGEPWLLIKDTDRYAKRGIDARIVEDRPNSVLSDRTVAQIAAAGEHEWHSNRSVKANVKAGAVEPSKLPGKKKSSKTGRSQTQVTAGKRASMPAVLAPLLATLVKTAPVSDDWLHEVKFDGYRMVSRLYKGKVGIFSRGGNDWTERLSAIAAEVKKLKAQSAWLDGEVCAINTDGWSDFQALQNALSEGEMANLVYFVFDLVYLNGFDLRKEPLERRKRLLQ
ncbi:MAG TPA: DNA polymerase ligase N-terminal domain-containing protein, partial [Chryseolinea sp.]|nr:DNA polymerase ligase N-terminal domain-containing protein [Chryseolinea sp.]